MLGIGMAALTRQPCNCAASDETIRKPWDPDQEPEQQQRFENPEDCFWRSVYGEHHNDWYIVKIKSVGKDDKAIETDIAEARHDILHHVASAISETVEKEKIGAVSTSEYEHAPNAYYLVEFIDTPYHDNGGSFCKAYWLNMIPSANNKLFTKSEGKTIVEMDKVVDTDVQVNPVPPSNMLPCRIRKQITNQIAVKISEDSHNFILDETFRREALEYDHSMVVVGGQAESSGEEEN